MSAAASHVIHISGKDEPGILSDLAGLIARRGVSILELKQTRVGGSLIIALSLAVGEKSETLSDLETYAREKAFTIHVLPALPPPSAKKPPAICVTLLGDVTRAEVVAQMTRVFREHGLNVRETRARSQVLGLEFFLEKEDCGAFALEEVRDLRLHLLPLGTSLKVDVAVQRDDFFRRSKRLLCMDVDSTFVKGEFIDELAELAGVKPQVAEITARAMRGELDFKAALRERVRLLRGLPMSKAFELCERYELSPGAHELVKTAKQLGLRVGLVSGGFNFFVSMLKERYGLDFAFANELEVKDGLLTGEVLGTIVDAERKEQVLRDMAHVYGIFLEQTIAAGDGANDILMLKTAGLGIAYQAKPRLQEVADAVFNHQDRLDAMLYLMGFDAPELTSACR